MAYTPIPTLKDVPRYPTRSDAERLDELMQNALNGGSDMVKALNKDFIPNVNAVIPALNSAMPNLDAIIAAPGMANQAAASATAANTAKVAAEAAKTAAATSASAAAGSATAANTAKTAAEAAKAAAATSETNAAKSATAAAGSATTATNAKTSAESARDIANSAKTSAEASKNAAAGSATSASNSATAAAGSAATATNAQTAAEAARDIATTAKAAAEASKNAAKTSETNAANSATAAAGSAATATSAKTAAESARDVANAAKTAAESAKNAAKTSETNAAASATAADTSATHAASSATNAAQSASEAKEYRDQTVDIAHVGPASSTKLGLVKIGAGLQADAAGVASVVPASTATPGIVQLDDTITSVSTTEAATPNAVRQVADLATSARVSSESWTLTAAVSAGGQITLPRGYIVGNHEMMLFKGGLLVNYVDVGTPGKWSIVCKLVGAASVGDVFTMVGPLGDAPSVVLDFEGGAWPKELVCSRATVDYVFDDAGKVREVPANTPAITRDPVTGRKGLQLFGQRTRLNKYYKSATNWAHNSARGTSFGQKEDLTSPTLTCVHCTYDKSKDSMLTGYYFRYNLFSDIGTDPLLNDTKYSITICAKASYGVWTVHIQDKIDGSASETPNFDISVTEEYTVITKTIVVKAGKYFRHIDIQNSFSNTADTAYIDIAYFQIEESATPTPLIAGAEGVQMTVGNPLLRYNTNDIWQEYSVYSAFISEKCLRQDGYGLLLSLGKAVSHRTYGAVSGHAGSISLGYGSHVNGKDSWSYSKKSVFQRENRGCNVYSNGIGYFILNGIKTDDFNDIDRPKGNFLVELYGWYVGGIVNNYVVYDTAIPLSKAHHLTAE